MVMRKKTLRRLSPVARKVARLAGEADSIGRRLKNMVVEIQRLEADSQALIHSGHTINSPTFEEELKEVLYDEESILDPRD